MRARNLSLVACLTVLTLSACNKPASPQEPVALTPAAEPGPKAIASPDKEPVRVPPNATSAEKPDQTKSRVLLSAEDADWVKKGNGKLTEADVIARFGPADEMRSPEAPRVIGDAVVTTVADYVLVWRDRTLIRVKFIKDEAVEYSASFSDRLPHKKATRESFKKIKLGLSSNEVEQLLGTSDVETKEWWYWGGHRTLTVTIKSGKVSGYGWSENAPGELSR